MVDTLPQARTTDSATATAGQTAFRFTYNVNYLDVFLNGVKLSGAEFTATDGSNITLAGLASLVILLNSYHIQQQVLDQVLSPVLTI